MIFYFHKYNKQNFPDTYLLYNEISGKCKILSWAEYLQLYFDNYAIGLETGRITEITLISRDPNKMGYIHFNMDILMAQDTMLYHTTCRNLTDLRKREESFQYEEIKDWIKMLIDWKNKE